VKRVIVSIISATVVLIVLYMPVYKKHGGCFTGAFIADRPTKKEISEFQKAYGKKPYFVLIFVDWNNFPQKAVLNEIFSSDCIPVITWEPWHTNDEAGIEYDSLLKGDYDEYLNEFAKAMKIPDKAVYLRFAHEMNGNWYPWSGSKIGAQKYIDLYRYVKDFFDKKGVGNIKWIFSINSEDVPSTKSNYFMNYYPGDEYVDCIGLDGYNWGNTKSWSKWISFKEIFKKSYNKITKSLDKAVVITEFGCADKGGDKSIWIKEAMRDIKNWTNIKGFILFNVNKEARWKISIHDDAGIELKKQLKDPYFKDQE
jgi:beta-mannanase